MRDLMLSFVIGGTVMIGATEMMGVTDVLSGQDPGAAVRSAVPDFPAMPHLPELIPDAARSMFSGSANAAPDPDATASPATEPQQMYIARTGGTGVRTRAACLDDAPGQGVATEGSAVTILRLGGRECPGWAFVTNGKSQFWVRMTYLDASSPRPSPAMSSDVTKPAGPKPPDQEQRNDRDDAARDDAKHKDEEKPTPTPTSIATSAPTATASPSAEPTPRRPPPTPRATPTEEPRDDEN